jgi:2-haloacid dehalogenase
MATARIKAVVFDIGGVLLDWDPRHLYRQLIADPDQLDDFLDRIYTRQWHLAHDLGADTEQSCRELAAKYPEHADLIMAWSDRSEEMVGGVLTQTVEVLGELRSAGVRCFVLSNMEPDKFATRRTRYEFFDLVEGCVISGLEGVAKPDQKIFDILMSRYGLAPAETVFIDDLPANVAAAAELGVVAIQFTTAAQLRSELRDLGLPVGAPVST